MNLDEVKKGYDRVDILDTIKASFYIINFIILIVIECYQKCVNLYISIVIILTIIIVVLDCIYKDSFYKAECNSREIILKNAFNVSLTSLKVESYYSIDEGSLVRRLILNIYKSIFFTNKTIDKVTSRYTIFTAIIFIIWITILLLLDISQPLLIITQMIFSSPMLGQFIDYLRFHFKLEKIEKEFYACLVLKDNGKGINELLLSRSIDYECLKSNCNISASTRIFLKNKEKWNEEWKNLLNRINDN